MAGLINVGAGLSTMGGAIAQQAGSEALLQQKSDLETAQATLLSQLQGEREHVGRVEQGQITGALQKQEQEAALTRTNVEQSGAMARTQLTESGATTRTNIEQSGALTRANIAANAPPDEVKAADWYSRATPQQKQALADIVLAKTGLPPSMFSPPSDSGADKPAGAGTATTTGGSSPGGTSTPAAAPVPGQVNPNNARAQQILDALPGPIKSQVTAMVEGRARPYAGAAMKDPFNRQTMMLAHEIDPTFDETTWNARNKLRSDWESGQTSLTLQALDQAAMHADHFDEVAHDLNNKGFTPYNAVANKLGPMFDDTRVNDFNRTNEAFASEMGKVYKGTGVLGEKELDDWKNTNSINSGPSTLSHTAPETMKLFDGRLDSLENKWRNSFGQNVPPPPMLSPDAQEVYDRLTRGAGKYASSKTGWPTSGPAANDIKALNDNPSLIQQFDAKYGAGAGQKYLGRWRDLSGDNESAGSSSARAPGDYIFNPTTGRLEPAK